MSKASTVATRHAFRFIDLFAGIGGCRLAFQNAGGHCVFTSEWNAFAQKTYLENFAHDSDHVFAGDVTHVELSDIPDHDVLVAGFPCQPFSIAGVSKKNALGRPHGFDDPTQGTLFFNVAQIIEKHRPRAFVLENVRNLESHDRGNTFKVIRDRLQQELGYHFEARVLNAAAVVPQRRQRIFMVGFNQDLYADMPFSLDDIDLGDHHPTLRAVLHRRGDRTDEPYTDRFGSAAERYVLTPALWEYLLNYKRKHRAAGNGFGYGLVGPSDVARTLSARYYKDGSEILINRGSDQIPRRLTPRECARLMGFPEDFRIPVSDSQAYKQFGNSVVVPVVQAVAEIVRDHL